MRGWLRLRRATQGPLVSCSCLGSSSLCVQDDDADVEVEESNASAEALSRELAELKATMARVLKSNQSMHEELGKVRAALVTVAQAVPHGAQAAAAKRGTVALRGAASTTAT